MIKKIRLAALPFFLVLSAPSCGVTEATSTSEYYHDNPWVDPDYYLEQEGVYCYRTIGDNDCYKRPQRSEHSRLNNYYGPPPP